MFEVPKKLVSNLNVEDCGHQTARTEMLLYYLIPGTVNKTKNKTKPQTNNLKSFSGTDASWHGTHHVYSLQLSVSEIG